jgi:Ras-related protein Rab-1A
VKSQIWDTAGQERFRVITSSYYRGSKGIMIVYDVSDRQSFHHVRMWAQEIEKYAGPDASSTCRLLVGNKSDVHSSKRVVPEDEGRELAEELGIHFVETSAKNAHNIEHAFDLLCQEIMTKVAPNREPKDPVRFELGRDIGEVSMCQC